MFCINLQTVLISRAYMYNTTDKELFISLSDYIANVHAAVESGPAFVRR